MLRLGYLIGVVWLWPDQAFAWGPGAHLDFGLQVLQGLALLAPLLRDLLAENSDDYLYGCIAADIIVGKNLAPYRDHCHNWQVGLKLRESARTPPQQALIYGYKEKGRRIDGIMDFLASLSHTLLPESVVLQITQWVHEFEEWQLPMPSSNSVMEVDFYRSLPHDTTLHTSRMYLDDTTRSQTFDNLAAAKIGDPGDDNWLVLEIAHLKPVTESTSSPAGPSASDGSDTSDPLQTWIPYFQAQACSQADGVASTSQETINFWLVDEAQCGGGPTVYILPLGDGNVISMFGFGPLDLGRRLINSLYT